LSKFEGQTKEFTTKKMNKLFIKLSVISGLLTGLSCFVLFLGLSAIGLRPLEEHQFLYFPLYALGMVAAMKYFRDYRNGGLMHGWQGIGMGLLINIFASLVYAGMIYTWLTYVSPEIFEKYKSNIITKVESDTKILQGELQKLDRDKPDEAKIYANWKAEMDDYANLKVVAENLQPSQTAWSIWMRTVGIGMVIGMGIGIFFKRKLVGFIQKPSSNTSS